MKASGRGTVLTLLVSLQLLLGSCASNIGAGTPCECYAGEGAYCGAGVAAHAETAGCRVAALAGHEGDLLRCEDVQENGHPAGLWSVESGCPNGCDVIAPGDADACSLPVCPCFVADAWCGTGAARHGLTLSPPCRVPLLPEHNDDVLACQGRTWVVKEACALGCFEAPTGTADDCNIASPYRLPFTCHTSQVCSQGNFGSSHQGSQSYAWDFAMARGTELRATRDGTVKYAELRSPRGSACFDAKPLSPDCHNRANFVGVRHADGTVALMMHLSAIAVKVGDAVKQGDLLGLSGNSGYTSGPHLHFQLQEDCGTWFCNSIPSHFSEAPGLARGVTVTSQNCR